jgi:hypothetical protein
LTILLAKFVHLGRVLLLNAANQLGILGDHLEDVFHLLDLVVKVRRLRLDNVLAVLLRNALALKQKKRGVIFHATQKKAFASLGVILTLFLFMNTVLDTWFMLTVEIAVTKRMFGQNIFKARRTEKQFLLK